MLDGAIKFERFPSLTMIVGEEKRLAIFHSTEYIYGSLWYGCALAKFDGKKPKKATSKNVCLHVDFLDFSNIFHLGFLHHI